MISMVLQLFQRINNLLKTLVNNSLTKMSLKILEKYDLFVYLLYQMRDKRLLGRLGSGKKYLVVFCTYRTIL
jgi:hypothetical protein